MIRIIIFDIANYVLNALPLKYRLSKFVLFVQSLLYGWIWDYNNFYVYRNSNAVTLFPWNNAATYGLNNYVVYNFSVYISLQAGNTGNNPLTAPTYWLLVCQNFIGVNERVKYDGRYLTLTWALNRYFQTTYRDPPYPPPYDFGLGAGTFSDIYITNAPISFVPFVVGLVSATSSMVSTGTTAWWVPVAPTYGTSSSYGFVVNIPTAVWTALGATSAIRNAVVNGFVAKYAVSGTTWTIVTY